MVGCLRSVVVFCSVIVAVFNESQCTLFPLRPFQDALATAMFPNERISLDDCHLRYYKHGEDAVVAPAVGAPTYLREFAHMAAIGWTQPDGTISWKCGGSLVWNNYVLTAAHCVTDNGTAPDVARFGDIDIFSDKDDRYAQQLRIVQIIRHPEHKHMTAYNDIALLKLEANVSLHPTVSPACLWMDDDIRFPNLEATGWGNTGLCKESTPSLLKVTLKPISNSECHAIYGTSIRKLREGIKGHQVCAGDVQMDTCPGDSGGPLQIKLLHNGVITPFLVGITSFGSACGHGTPGVYTRVSSFANWIEETIRRQENYATSWSMDPMTCALQFVNLREYEDDIIIHRTEDFVKLDTANAHMAFNIRELNHVVSIGWNSLNVRRNNCSGTLIADDVVLTLAECASHTGIAASFIDLGGAQTPDRIDIAEIIVHPAYRANSLYNNIAVLKLRSRVKFNRNRTPVCIWNSHDIPSPQLYVAGIGRKDINTLYLGFQFGDNALSEVLLLPRASVNSKENCTIPKEFRSRLTNGLAEEHLCVGNRLFLVPNSCRLVHGAPMQRSMFRTDRYFTFAYGLNSFGRDCGFGEAAVSTRIYSHMDWLKTVLLPNYRTANSVQFANPDWKENDACDYDGNTPAVCTHYTKCPKVWDDFKAQRIVHFCTPSSFLCCPRRFVLKERLKSDELATCDSEYKSLHPKYYNILKTPTAPHIVTLIGTSASNRCLGSLITKSIVITTASCVASPNILKEMALGDGSIVSIRQTIIHPNYDRIQATNDIALVYLQRPIVPTAEVYPACIWTNLTHTPLHLRLYRENHQISKTPQQMVTMYNADCQRDYRQKISVDQLCADQVVSLNPPNSCYNAGDQLIWPQPNDESTATSHIVGLYSYGEQCSSNNPGVFTRISSYVEWIRENI